MVDHDSVQGRGDDAHLASLLVSQAFPVISSPDLHAGNDVLRAGRKRSQKRNVDIDDHGGAGIERDARWDDNGWPPNRGERLVRTRREGEGRHEIAERVGSVQVWDLELEGDIVALLSHKDGQEEEERDERETDK